MSIKNTVQTLIQISMYTKGEKNEKIKVNRDVRFVNLM